MNRKSGKKSPAPGRSWKGVDLKTELREVEKRLIKRALKAAGGNRSEAARLLNLKRQTLNYLLDSRYPELVAADKKQAQ